MTAAGSVAAAVPRRRLGVRARVVGGVITVAGPQGPQELDEVAGFLYRQIDGTRTLAELAGRLRAEYAGVDAETALADVTELIADLVGAELVELRAPGG